MKILGICLSNRKGGNSEILLGEALRGARECQAATELIATRTLDIKACQGCFKCAKEGMCVTNDDMQNIYDKLLDADGIIFSVPVYFWSLPGAAKTFLDRTYALRFPKLRLMNKIGAAISVASSSGNTEVHSVFNMYFMTNHMITTDYVSGYAFTKGNIEKDRHAMLASYELGRLVSLLYQNGNKYPDEFCKPVYSMVHAKYGIHQSPYEND